VCTVNSTYVAISVCHSTILSAIPSIGPFSPFDFLLSATPFCFPPPLSDFPQRLSNFPQWLSIFQEIQENLSTARSGVVHAWVGHKVTFLTPP
jgi:hypothetical protein